MTSQYQQQHQHSIPAQQSTQQMNEEEKIFLFIQQILQPQTRETALQELSKRRESFDDLAPVLWYSFGKLMLMLMLIISANDKVL